MAQKTNDWNAVIVALLGVIGALLVAVIGLMGSQKAATELSISATMTAEVKVTAGAIGLSTDTASGEIGVSANSLPTQTPIPTDVSLPSASIVPVQEFPTTEPTRVGWEIARFAVEAGVPKNITGITVNAGDQIVIQYLDGQWTGRKANPGLSMGCKSSHIDSNTNLIWPLPLEEWGDAMIGYIGAEPFGIGCQSVEVEAFTAGDLYLGMNDCQNCFSDNGGTIFVRVLVRRK